MPRPLADDRSGGRAIRASSSRPEEDVTMLHKIRRRASFANVTSLLALFVALGGSAWALQANSVGTRQLKDNAVKTKKIADSAVKTRKIAGRAVTAAKLAASEPYHEVGAAGEPAFQNGWDNGSVAFSTAAFTRIPSASFISRARSSTRLPEATRLPSLSLRAIARLKNCSCLRAGVRVRPACSLRATAT
jgi:hypothetical protein